MRAAAIVTAALLASTARAQTPPSEGASQNGPAAPAMAPAAAPAATPTTAPAAPAAVPATAPAVSAAAPAAAPATPAIGYEQGVGLRYKTPRTTVALYGILEPTLSTVDHANASGQRQTGYQVSWFSGNRWGITGSQGLVRDNGLKAIFKLESEFELPTGNMDTPGVLFNRDAWAGLEGELGKITFGRQNTLPRDFSQNYGDAYGSAGVTLEEGGWTNVNNFKQLIFFAGSVTGTRYDDGVVWKKKFGDHIVAGLGYQFGGVAGSFSQNSTRAVALAINYAPVNVSGYYNEANNHGNDQRSMSVGGNYQVGIARLNAGYFHYEADQGSLGRRKDDAYTLSAKVAPTAEYEFDLGYQRINVNHAAYNSSDKIINQFADTSSATTAGTGAKKTIYGSAIYHFNSLTQIYLAFDYAKVTDGYRTGGGVAGKLGASGTAANPTGWYATQTEIAAGMRVIF